MKVFICGFNDFSLAIPINYISSLFLHSKEAEQVSANAAANAADNAVEYNAENKNSYVSLPRLLKLSSDYIKHGLVLKQLNSETGEPEENNIDEDVIIENKIILLTTAVKREAEIPGEEIFPMPKMLGGVSPLSLFSGIKFDSGETTEAEGHPLLFLNVKNLVNDIQKRRAA